MMKIKDKLMPTLVIEIDNKDIPLHILVDFFNDISDLTQYYFYTNEEDIKNILLNRKIISPVKHKEDYYEIIDSVEMDNIKNDFWDLYDKINYKQIERNRKLSNLI